MKERKREKLEELALREKVERERRKGINRVEDMENEREINGKMVVVRTRQAYVSAHSAQQGFSSDGAREMKTPL